MIELVLVLLLVSILSLFILPRLFDLTVFDAHGYFDSLDAALGFARREAIASECPVSVSLSGTGYALDQAPACTTGSFSQPVVNPASGQAYTGILPSGISQSTSPLTQEILFNSSGMSAAQETVTITGGGFSGILTIESGTGLVTHSP